MRTVFITGASSGFGAATARRFAARGDRVIAAARRTDRLRSLADELGPDVLLPLTLDVRDRASVERVTASLPPDWAEIDILVNNAGLALGLESAQEADLDQWVQMIETNCTGLVIMTRALLPRMVARGTRAHRQPRLDRGHLPVPGRQRLRRDEGLRPSVQPQPALRPARHRDQGHLHRTRAVGRHRVLAGQVRRRRRAGRGRLHRDPPADRRRHRRRDRVGDEPAAERERQHHRTDGDQPELRPVPDLPQLIPAARHRLRPRPTAADSGSSCQCTPCRPANVLLPK